MKNIFILFLSIFASVSANAATNLCSAVDGTHMFKFEMNYNLDNPDNNKPDTEIPEAYNWDLGDTYQAVCDCTEWPSVYYTANVPDLPFDRTFNNKQYYKITDRLSFSASVFIAGGAGAQQNFPAPFVGQSKYQQQPATRCGINSPSKFATGSKGVISLLFDKAMVGETTIPNTKILSIYGATSATVDATAGAALAEVYMSGTVTVPQSCEINDGQVIDVPFDEINTTDLSEKGKPPKGFTPKTVELSLKCNNISEGVKLSLIFSGTAADKDPSSLKTSNNDVGVRIEDSQGTLIKPNEGKLPVTFDYENQKGSTSISTYPVNTTGSEPDAGNFDATATITTNME